MRKCSACGYLLFGDGETCNHCGAAVAVLTTAPAAATTTDTPSEPRLWRPSPVAPPMPTPAAAAPPPPPASAPPPASPNAYATNGIWRPDPLPVVTVPKRSTPNHGKVAMVLVIALLLGGVAYAVNAQRNALPAGTSAFAAGKGVEFTAPDDSFSAQFPAAPHAETQPITVQGTLLQLNEATVETDDYEMAVASIVLPVSVPQDRVDQLLDDSLTNGFAGAHGTITRSDHITRGGLPAVDAHAKDTDGYGARIEVIVWGNKLYLFGVHAKSGVDRLFKAMDASLQLR